MITPEPRPVKASFGATVIMIALIPLLQVDAPIFITWLYFRLKAATSDVCQP